MRSAKGLRPRRHSGSKIVCGVPARTCIVRGLRRTFVELRFIRFARGVAMRLGSVLTVSYLAFAASAEPELAQGHPCPHPGALGLTRTSLYRRMERYGL